MKRRNMEDLGNKRQNSLPENLVTEVPGCSFDPVIHDGAIEYFTIVCNGATTSLNQAYQNQLF